MIYAYGKFDPPLTPIEELNLRGRQWEKAKDRWRKFREVEEMWERSD